MRTPRLHRIVAGATVAVAAVAVPGLASATMGAATSNPGNSVSAGVLGAPVSAAASAASSTSISVTVTTGPSPIAAGGYVVRPHGSTSVTSCTISGATGSCTVSGLSSGTAYQFDVYSTLSKWTSGSSKTVGATTASSAAVNSLAPVSGAVGSSASLSASGFLPSHTLTVTVGGVSAPITSGGTTGSNGSATVDFTIPLVSSGSQPLVVSDGSNRVTASSSYSVLPGVTSLLIANKAAGTAGKPESGDTISVGFNAALRVNTLCSMWSGDTLAQTLSNVTVTFNKGTGSAHDTITFASSSCSSGANFGSVDLGAGGGVYTNGSTGATFTNSTVAYSYNSTTGMSSLVLTLGGLNSGTPKANANNLTATWSESDILSTAGSALNPISVAESAELF